jgi:hypothetical protein
VTQRMLIAIVATAVLGVIAGSAVAGLSRPGEADANGSDPSSSASSREVVAQLRETNAQLRRLNRSVDTLNRRVGTRGADDSLTGTTNAVLRVLGTNSYIPGTVRNLLRRICENVERPDGPVLC